MASTLQIRQLDRPTDKAVEPEKWIPIDRAKMINKLNYLNFQEFPVLVTLRHPKYRQTVIIPAGPLPCVEDRIDCLWDKASLGKKRLEAYLFQNFLVSDGLKLLLFKPEVLDIDEERISFLVPESYRVVRSRQIRRHPSRGVQVQLFQNSTLFHGIVEDYSPIAFRIKLELIPPQTFQWINPELEATVILSDEEGILYSGVCRLLRQSMDQKKRSFVVEPATAEIHRYQRRKYRSTRQQISPAPRAAFRHPLLGKNVSLEIIDLSGSGFSVREDEEKSVLLPGMMLPEVTVRLASGFKIPCNAQVVSRHDLVETPERKEVKCGLALLDMKMEDHVKLMSLLYQAKDCSWHICDQVDMDSLWDFFFETGFIYPEKYSFIQANKKKLKETYEKLYTQCPNIARHFIFQERGTIFGHMAMLRAYESAWMIHHHAASKATSKRAGLMVLRQISHYVADVHRLSSAHLDFVFCYFRPSNKFPKRIFGGTAEHIGDRRGCSTDTFAYFHFPKDEEKEGPLPAGWKLEKAGVEDLSELESFYEGESGGLMITALDLEPNQTDREDLRKEYEKIGLRSRRLLFSLKNNDLLKAVIMVNASDIGLNMSELTNCIKIVVLDQDGLSREIVHSAIGELAGEFDKMEIPILLYPTEYAEEQAFPVEREYVLWILSVKFLDDYFEFCQNLLRRF